MFLIYNQRIYSGFENIFMKVVDFPYYNFFLLQTLKFYMMIIHRNLRVNKIIIFSWQIEIKIYPCVLFITSNYYF